MPFRIPSIYSDLQGIAASGLGTQQIPVVGQTFGIMLELRKSTGVALTAAEIIADVNYIEVTANGQQLFYMTARNLLGRNDYYYAGRGGSGATPTAFTAGTLFIPFFKPEYPTAASQELFGIGVDIRTLQVNVAFNGTIANLTGGRIGVASLHDMQQVPTAQHLRITNTPQTISSTGRVTIQNLNLEKSVGCLAYHIEVPVASVINQAVVFGNGAELMRINRNTLINQQKMNGRIPQLPVTNDTAKDLFTIDFNESNDLETFLRLGDYQDLRIELDISGSAPNTFNFYREAVWGIAV